MSSLFLRARGVLAIPRRLPLHGIIRRPVSSSWPAAGAAAARQIEDDEDHITFRPEPRYRTILPVPLPSDVETTPDNSSLYPSTRLLDTLSLLSICLRRPQSVKRAYLIFTQLLADVHSGNSPVPEATVWGEVVEAIGRNAHAFDPEQPGRAQQVAADLVRQWEELSSRPSTSDKDMHGLKVYQGWFRGLVFSSSPLGLFDNHIDASHLPLNILLDAFAPSELPLAIQALSAHAAGTGNSGLASQLERLKGERENLANNETEVVAELKPVLEASRGARKTASDPSRTQAQPVAIEPRFAITNLKTSLAPIGEASIPLVRQYRLEESSLEAARAEMANAAADMRARRGSAADDHILQQSQLQSWMFDWLELLKAKLDQDISAMRARVDEIDPETIDKKPQRWGGSTQMKPANLLLYITLLPTDKLALISILEIMRLAGAGGIPDGMKTLRGLLAVGKAVETEYRADTIKASAGTDSPEWLRTLDPQTQKPNRALVATVWNNLGKQTTSNVPVSLQEDLRNVWTPAWSQMIRLAVGSFLVDALLSVAKVARTGKQPKTGEEVTEIQEAFSHSYEFVRGRLLGVIKLNPVVASRLARDRVGVVMHPKHLPMLVPPRPWRSYDDGAYLIHRVPLMRFKDSNEQVVYLKKASADGVLEPVFAGLDVLSATPWKINRAVYDVVSQVWNSGEALADIPASAEKSTYERLPSLEATGDSKSRLHALNKIKSIILEKRKDHADRCKVNYTLEVARSYLGDNFYIPHNLDFRGRAYPIPPHLSPVGDDVCRGLLAFGVAKPLGKTGFKWLQIHLANVFGYDKASFEERMMFTQDHEADIMDSADRPLDGRRWWLKAEDPWQCLAACFEVTNALRSSDPEEYPSNLPVHQDGTCNGMQHYAALGGDSQGAKAVNLENGDRPADIYTRVADLANEVIRQDALNGVKLAQLIVEPLGRKVVKQTVMTTVYGVSFIGAKDQIAKQLVARGDIERRHIFALSGYVAKTVLGCIGDLFGGATAIQDWLTVAARLISRSVPPERESEASKPLITRSKFDKGKTRGQKELMTSVVWTTPLGLPVVQPYRKAIKKQVMTALQTVFISDPNAPSEVSPRKQATAFPPNFIHSLDATHMLLTALKCRQHDITFAAVHDSFWTHAATVEPMSSWIRDTFVHLHSQDLIGELRQEFLDRYGDHMIPKQTSKVIAKAAAKKSKKPIASPAGEVDQPQREADHELVLDENDSAKRGSRLGSTNGLKFIRFADALPPCPPKGEFDVNKIRASRYFFS